MNKNKYLISLDDACPTMSAKNWQRIEDILDSSGVRPMVGIIPKNSDPKQQIDNADPFFWNKVKKWENKGWAIALHGYDHCYISEDGLKGLNPLWSRSEFAGIPLEQQKMKIRNGINIFKEHGIEPKYFFAPSHTYDCHTLQAIKEESNIRIISDTIATKPYRNGVFIFIPLLCGHCTEIKLPGIWTFCLHPSIMTEEDFLKTEKFLKSNKEKFISFQELNLTNLKDKNYVSKLLSFVYFLRRKIKNMK